MSSGQAFGVHGKWSTCKAQALSTCIQPIQEWWVMGHGSEVRESIIWRWGEGKAYSGVPAHILLGVMSCWDDIPPKKRKDKLESLGACHEG